MDFDAIITGIRKAIYGREVREYIASSMEWTRDFVNQSITNIKELLRQAEAARDAAKASQDAAKVSETNAKTSENAAKASQNAAASSASAAAGSASAAKTSETKAKTSETNAKASENAAKTSETNAKTSETNAKTSETNAKTSETNAKSSESKAATSADNAKTSEVNAKASADSMGTSVATCTAKAKEAEASAGKAAASEGNAKTSEGNAKASENEARQLVEAAKKVVNTDKTLTIDGAPADAKTVGDKFKSIKTDWKSVTDKPETFPPSAHNHSKLTFEHQNEVNFVGTPENNIVYWGYRDNTIDEYRFNDGRGSGSFANVRANKFIGSLEGNADTATKATGVTDYNNPSGIIQIGWANAGLNTSNLTHIAGYTDNGTKIKDVSKDVLKSWLGLDSAASGVQSSGSNYIRFGDGTQICWGTIGSTSVQVTGTVSFELYQQTQHETATLTRSGYFATFPQPFANTSYSVAMQKSYDVTYSDSFKGGDFTYYSSRFDFNVTGASFTSISSTVPSMGKATTNCSFSGGSGSMYVAVGCWK